MKDIDFRLMVEGDIPYIKSTFLASFRNSPFTNLTSDHDYKSFFSPLFEELILSEDTTVALAVNPKDENHIYAWCAIERLGRTQLIHYVYTKMSYRKFGIATELLKSYGADLEKPFYYTLFSRDCASLRRQYKQAVYNPYLLLRSKPAKES